jgi:hypothetical protein
VASFRAVISKVDNAKPRRVGDRVRASDRVAGLCRSPEPPSCNRLEENLGAANVHLTADDLAEIERAASAIPTEGERYPEQLLATTGR